MKKYQQTLKNEVVINGIGLHSGKNVTMNIKPSLENSGIAFKRTDIPESQVIPARWDYVLDTQLCTVIGTNAENKVGTIEHVMAALAGCEVDNALIEIDAPEVPILDGSSQPFVDAIQKIGVKRQKAERRFIKVEKQVSFKEGDAYAKLQPKVGMSIDLGIDFGKSALAKQQTSIEFTGRHFNKDFAAARTFCFYDEVEQMRSLGLARGGSLENAVVIDRDDQIMNADGLRHDDEFVRHKILDCVGDLYLAGYPILGHFEGWKSGHRFNNQVLKALFEDDDAWCYVTASEAANLFKQEQKASHAKIAAVKPQAAPVPQAIIVEAVA